jgi:hypothetical protein
MAGAKLKGAFLAECYDMEPQRLELLKLKARNAGLLLLRRSGACITKAAAARPSVALLRPLGI